MNNQQQIPHRDLLYSIEGVNHQKALQNRVLNDRKARLKVLNENENGVDNALLFDGPQPFTIHRPPGFDGHILEVSSKFCQRQLRIWMSSEK